MRGAECEHGAEAPEPCGQGGPDQMFLECTPATCSENLQHIHNFQPHAYTKKIFRDAEMSSQISTCSVPFRNPAWRQPEYLAVGAGLAPQWNMLCLLMMSL